jgi:branched-chain amino acid transport system permease protein
MLGAYLAYSLTQQFSGPFGYFGAMIAAALVVALIGALVETTLLRRIYEAPELFQLLATFGLTLMVEDLVVIIWGPEDLLGARAPGLTGAIDVFGQKFPAYDFLLIALGPMVLGLLWVLFHKTRWGVLVRAATQDRIMVSALGVNQAWLFTSVFTLGIFLAGLGGAVQIPREAVHHTMDLQIIVEVFVVVVIGGLGNVLGAFLAAIIISELNAFGILLFPKITLVLVFLVMAVVLVVRPWGLLGRPDTHPRPPIGAILIPFRRLSAQGRYGAIATVLALAALPMFVGNYGLAVAAEILIFALFAMSLHLMMGGWRHGEFRPCGLFRPRGLWRGSAGQAFRGRHGARTDSGPAARPCRGCRLWLVLRAAFWRLFRHADPRLRPDHLVGGVSVV